MPRTAHLTAPGRRPAPVWMDRCLAAVALVDMQVQLALNQHLHHRAVEVAAAVIVAGTLAVRRRWPSAALVVATCAAALTSGLGGRLAEHTLGPILAVVVLFYGAGNFLPERRARLALALGLAGFAAYVLLTTPDVPDLAFDLGVLGAAPWALGRMLRLRAANAQTQRELAERVDAEREQHERATVRDERTRIARELHDVITHSVSVMVIQAGGARVVMGSDPDRAVRSLRAVEQAGREALAEMRRLLGLLDDGQDPTALAPQPGLADLPALITQARAAGLGARLLVEGEAAAIPPGLDLTAYRIVQEALTNAVKHAGRVPATVRIRWCSDAVELDIRDHGRNGETVRLASDGHGIPGMRERAALQGGSIELGPGLDGGFHVRARLPVIRSAA